MIHRRRTAISNAVNEKPGDNQDRLRKRIRRAVQRQGRPDAGLAWSQDAFKQIRCPRKRKNGAGTASPPHLVSRTAFCGDEPSPLLAHFLERVLAWSRQAAFCLA